MNTVKYSVSMVMNPGATTGEDRYLAAARVQMNKSVSSKEFVQHISDHNGVFSRGTVKGVTTDLVSCLREMLTSGNKVEIEGLGSFFISLQCKTAKSVEEFTANNIEKVSVVFTPSGDLENLINDITFEQVTTRRVQAAALKAEKAGETTVDISKDGGATDGGE